VSRVGEAAAATSSTTGRVGRPVVIGLLVLSVAVQLVVLYSPDGGGPALFPQADKVVHLLVFLVPVALAVVAGFRRRAVVAVFAAQAVLSEVVQATVLPNRSGDVLDAVADLAGVALGVLVGTAVLRMRESRGAGRPPA
jgi:VanZ family protein